MANKPGHVEPDAVVIGAGPAGLAAAGELAAGGYRVTVAEAMPSAGRKLLMAGKSGLNLTKDEPLDQFIRAYAEAAPWLQPMVAAFGPQEVQAWARQLDQEVFSGTTGRVFPTSMKASPLLRAWLRQLDGLGVSLHTRWRWTGWGDGALTFETPQGTRQMRPAAVVLAMGGASWRRLGSDGAWAQILNRRGVALAPFAPANAGVTVNWSDHMRQHFGKPLKGVALASGAMTTRGEAVISSRGLEGGGVYAVSRPVREGHQLVIDLRPDVGVVDVTARLSRPRGRNSLSNHLRKTLKLGPVRRALLQEFARPLPDDPAALAAVIKALPVPHSGLRPLDEAISTAGGVCRSAVDEGLMLIKAPGVFCAGEMLDWEAPTGGYLLTACLATGRWAGRSAGRYLAGMVERS